MPIIRVSALPQPPHVDTARVLTTLCVKVAETLDAPVDTVWGTWQTISPGLYVEGENPSRTQPVSTHPPIAECIAFEGRSSELIEKVLHTIADVLAEELRMERGNAFITYTEAKSGQVYTGGAVRRRTS